MKVGFVGFGEINSPPELIKAKCLTARVEIESLGFPLVTTAVVTDDAEGKDVARAIADLGKERIEVLIVCLAGWIPSHAVIAIAHEYAHKPIVLWGLAGDLENGRIVTAAAQAGTTALRKVFADLGYKFRYVYNIIGQPSPLHKIASFVSAAFAQRSIVGSRVGMMGFRDMKLYNTLYEGLSLKKDFGIDVEFFEMLELLQEAEQVDETAIEPLLNKIRSEWHFVQPVDEGFLEKGIRYYLALLKIARDNGYDALSLKDVDGMKKLLHFPPAFLFMLLSDEAGLCTIPENDVMGAVTQLIVKQLTGQCGAYFEFYEFFENGVLMGVPDYVPAEVVKGGVKVTRAAFGGISGGLLNISEVKTGRMTLARLSNTGSRYTMHIVTGTASPVKWEEAGWEQPAPQLPSFELTLDQPVDDFSEKVSGQHYIVAYGDQSGLLKDFCYLKNINVI
ncbi:hypothetical protein [Agriterribacter sp.]|uniref:hypothetical protein n=1 Tax=Agriterribacter sp. TaxID=2821509 RepID=UPI002C411AD7|nr:hypothetical protein [Agriterribacter sp.]HRP55474.1 hypothetical protein [Agriterribacter sp.]